MRDRVWAVISLVLLLIGLGGGYFIGISMAPAQVGPAPKPELTGTIPIGVVMIGDTAPRQVPPMEEWLEEEINYYLTQVLKKNFTIDLLLEYAERSPALALEKLQTLYAQGVRIALSFRWSSSIKAVIDYANEHKIVIISDGSTSPLLSIPNDYVFRLVPNDNLQSRALLAIHRNLGTKAIVLIYRGDAWGDGLAEKFKEFSGEFGVEIVGEIRYSPEATEFSGEVAQLSSLIESAKERYGNNVAVQTFSFGEISTILKQAAEYDILMNTLWVGSDGYVNLPEVVRDAPEEAFNTVHISTIYAVTKSAKWEAYAEKYRSITGEDPGAYAAAFYDSAWIAALAIAQAGVYDGEVLKEVIPHVAANYFGVTGWTLLDETGDRAAADYTVYFVGKNEAGEIVWIPEAAIVDVVSGEVKWNIMPDLSRFGWELPAGASTPSLTETSDDLFKIGLILESLIEPLNSILELAFELFIGVAGSIFATVVIKLREIY